MVRVSSDFALKPSKRAVPVKSAIATESEPAMGHSPGQGATGPAMVAAANALMPLLRERADVADRERAVSADSFQMMSDAGLFKMFKPKKYGGFELEPHDHAMVTLALARGCASSGWLFTLYNTNNLFVLSYPEAAQEELWAADPDAVLAGATQLNAKSKAKRVPGGYQLSGSWGFNSGSDFSTWLILHAAVEDEPTSQMFLVPKSATRTVDDWFPTGMRGTGSRTMVVEDVFIPNHRAIPPTQLLGSGKYSSLHPTFDLLESSSPFSGLYLFSAVAAGVAQGAVDYFIENGQGLRRAATPLGGEVKLAEQDYVATQLTEAAGELDLAIFKIVETSKQASERVRRRESPLRREIVADQRDNAIIGRIAARAVNTVHALLGSKACFEGHPASRAKRDVEMIMNHVALNWRAASVLFLADALEPE
jgi:alkylation response protein AidB-like acyl-CoA dehydrogenase